MKTIKLKVKSASDAELAERENFADIAYKANCYAGEFEAAVGTLVELADQFNCLCKKYYEKTGERWWTSDFIDDGGVCHSPNEYGGIDFKGLVDWCAYANREGKRIVSRIADYAHP